jgi:hypothetical protein
MGKYIHGFEERLIKENKEFEKIYSDIINSIPDSDVPSETNLIEQIGDKWIYVEGWCDRCFSNYDVYDRDEMVDMARELTLERLEKVPYLPQYRFLSNKKLTSWKFVELPENSVNYALSIGIYK